MKLSSVFKISAVIAGLAGAFNLFIYAPQKDLKDISPVTDGVETTDSTADSKKTDREVASIATFFQTAPTEKIPFSKANGARPSADQTPPPGEAQQPMFAQEVIAAIHSQQIRSLMEEAKDDSLLDLSREIDHELLDNKNNDFVQKYKLIEIRSSLALQKSIPIDPEVYLQQARTYFNSTDQDAAQYGRILLQKWLDTEVDSEKRDEKYRSFLLSVGDQSQAE